MNNVHKMPLIFRMFCVLVISPGIIRQGREAVLFNAEVNNGGAIPLLLHISSWRGA
jgi:hypothetical protein